MSNRFHGVIIGEYGVGKTSLMYGLVGKPVPKDHIPTLMEIHCLELDQKHHLELVLTDTPGNDDYHKIAQMALISKDLVILCYSMEDNSSYHSISDKVWTSYEYCMCNQMWTEQLHCIYCTVQFIKIENNMSCTWSMVSNKGCNW